MIPRLRKTVGLATIMTLSVQQSPKGENGKLVYRVIGATDTATKYAYQTGWGWIYRKRVGFAIVIIASDIPFVCMDAANIFRDLWCAGRLWCLGSWSKFGDNLLARVRSAWEARSEETCAMCAIKLCGWLTRLRIRLKWKYPLKKKLSLWIFFITFNLILWLTSSLISHFSHYSRSNAKSFSLRAV